MSCPFKDLFGKPRTGAHSFRIADIAVVDTVATLIAAWFIHKQFFPGQSYWTVLLIFFIIGELLHYLFCVETTVIKAIRSVVTGRTPLDQGE